MSGGLRFSTTALMPESLRKAAERAIEKGLAEALKPARRKYGNSPTTVDGIRFDSKREARRYEELQRMRAAGEIAWFILQPTFILPGGIRYRADFLVVLPEGGVRVEDVKSRATKQDRVYINKRRQVKALYGVEVVEI